jgi:YHS domain-containing protein
LQIFDIKSGYKTGIQTQERDPGILRDLANLMGRFILFFLLFVVFYYVFTYLVRNVSFWTKRPDHKAEPEELVQDPCCQTYVPKGSAVKKRIAGKTYYFCNSECLKKYLENL